MHPFSIFPTDLLAHDLSGLELRVLIALYSFRGKNTNTVWPSLDTLAAVAGVADKTTVSKVTTRLAEKGFLTKKKRGFTGGNSYELIVPELDGNSPNLDKTSNLEEPSISNLDETSNSNLDKTSKCNEHTIEHTNEQTSVVALVTTTSVAVAPATRKNTGTRLPSDWVLPRDFANWAIEHGLNRGEVIFEAQKFRDYWVAKTGRDATKADWAATWRNWIRNRNPVHSQKTHAERTQDFKEQQAERAYAPLLNASQETLAKWGLVSND